VAKSEKQLSWSELFETAKQTQVVITSCVQTQDAEIGEINHYSNQYEIKQIAKKAGQDLVTTFTWEFTIALATLKYWSPDEQL